MLVVLLLSPLSLSTSPTLWRELNVPQAAHARLDMLTRNRKCFDDKPLMRARHRALADALGDDLATKLLLRAPLLLTHDLEATIGPKLEQLAELLPGADLRRVLVRAPTLLHLPAH